MSEIKSLQQAEGKYNIYPAFKLDDNNISEGYKSLVDLIVIHKTIIVEGYLGVPYSVFRNHIDKYLEKAGFRARWIESSSFLKSPEEIRDLVSPFTGGKDPLFGKRADLSVEDFFNITHFKKCKPSAEADLNIIIGAGSSLAGWKGLLIYIDLPKNELQYRSRKGNISNLGSNTTDDPKKMYKRFYFVDWIVLNKLKKQLLPEIDIIIDGQDTENILWMTGENLRDSLRLMSRNVFRAKPWFEPGTWGGKWIMDHIGGLDRSVANYAWSFELITPENGLIFESSGKRLEVSFDFLMYQEAENVLGSSFDRFGSQFPIRFDFLDTFDGGNLSIQCHPRPDYIKDQFGEDFTQEESYYILDTKENAIVFLGFQDTIDPSEFESSLRRSIKTSKPVDISQFIQTHESHKHDLFLIPYGTIHGSGKNNLVLEISSTPYIFTFKMYDWLRPDLDGNPRPLNIERGMENLYFDRKGDYVKENLISKPVLIDEGKDWQLYHLPTHKTHLYDVHRFHFHTTVDVKTENKCHVLSLVEGSSIIVETEQSRSSQFNYAETFIVPAAAGSYRIINKSDSEAIVVMAFVK